jgi:chemotaxis protein methyltransferase WspC
MARLEAALRARVGLDAQTLGNDGLGRAWRQLTAAGPLGGDGSVEQLLDDEGAFYRLVEELVVLETWFFRDVQPFRALRRYVSGRWQPDAPDQPLRVLSVPCSTGEEPYSISMTLLDLGLPPGRLRIDAVDLSQLALEKAARGVYGRSSFRGDEKQFHALCGRFIHEAGGRLVVAEEARAPVRFRQANLVAPDFLLGEPPYHVIFCRNLLIYFDADARLAALRRLRRLLTDDGLLYVGHVEARVAVDGPFRTLDDEYACAFTPLAGGWAGEAATATGSGGPPAPEDRPRPVPPAAASASRGGPEQARKRARPARKEAVSAAKSLGDLFGAARRKAEAGTKSPPPGSLKTARQAADCGRLDEAKAICQSVLTNHPANADAFCLLGLISQAQGALAEAEKHFRKALYLTPRHHEALVHMMLLAERMGDEKRAAGFRRRIEQAAALGD